MTLARRRGLPQHSPDARAVITVDATAQAGHAREAAQRGAPGWPPQAGEIGAGGDRQERSGGR
jgi:hypothetical protein